MAKPERPDFMAGLPRRPLFKPKREPFEQIAEAAIARHPKSVLAEAEKAAAPLAEPKMRKGVPLGEGKVDRERVESVSDEQMARDMRESASIDSEPKPKKETTAWSIQDHLASMEARKGYLEGAREDGDAKPVEIAKADVAEKKVYVTPTGRPRKVKPWEEEGITRQAWYKRGNRMKGKSDGQSGNL